MALDPFIPGAASRAGGAQFVEMRMRLEQLQQQLATGKKADTFAGLGADRRISLDVRAKLSTLDGYTRTISQADLRIQFLNQNLQGLSKLALDGKSDARPGSFIVGADGKAAGQLLATEKLSTAIDMLNTEVGGRYLFSGRSHDVKPVAGFAEIMGTVTSQPAGVMRLVDERRQADAGVADRGRLQAAAVAGTTVTLQREAADPPFGFTLSAATSSAPTAITAALVGPAPNAVSFDVTANPAAGSTVSFTLTLPDQTTRTVVLEARTTVSVPPVPNTFVIGATPAATAANLATAVDSAVQVETRTSLNAASALVAARDFFNGFNGDGTLSAAPQRIVPPFATAIATVPATAADTVQWYRGDTDAAVSSRGSATLQVDQSQVVAVGARANEEGFREMLANLAAFAAGSFPATDPESRDRYEAYTERVRTGLAFSGKQKPEDVAVEISTARVSMSAAVERHKIAGNFLTDAMAEVEDTKPEAVASAILALQTRLQATYQTTSILSRLSLVNYLS